MVDLSRLEALLRLDERGEYIVEQLSRLLVDRRKRRLLLIQLHEIDQDRESREEDTVLTLSEAEVFRVVMDARKPVTTAEVQSMAEGDSLRKYRQHASATLNNLTAKGMLGKVRGPGRQMYFAPAKDAVRLALMNADGTNLTQLTDSPLGEFYPSWSPDSRRITFAGARLEGNVYEDFNIYVIGADGSNLIQLTDHPSYDHYPAWSPGNKNSPTLKPTETPLPVSSMGDSIFFLGDL